MAAARAPDAIYSLAPEFTLHRFNQCAPHECSIYIYMRARRYAARICKPLSFLSDKKKKLNRIYMIIFQDRREVGGKVIRLPIMCIADIHSVRSVYTTSVYILQRGGGGGG